MTDNTPTTDETITESDARLNYLALGLLVVIIVALAGLWIIERGKTRRARKALAEIQERYEDQNRQVRTVLGLEPPKSIDRQRLPHETVDYQGESRRVLLLDVGTARRLGLDAGDLLYVPPRSSDGSADAPERPASR
jgi:hypothetical protein